MERVGSWASWVLKRGGVVVLVLAMLAWYDQPERGRLRVVFLDTPGDAVLIHTPGGGTALIDGGEEPSTLALALGDHLPFWRRSLDAVVLTRYDETRMPGQVAALTRYRARVVLAPATLTTEQGEHLRLATLAQQPGQPIASSPPTTALLVEWLHLLREQQATVRLAQVGDRLALDGAVLTMLATGEERDSGLVLQIDYGSARVMIVGTCAAATDAEVLAAAQPATLLAYPWVCALDVPLVESVQPQALIFTDGESSTRPALLTYAERARFAPRLYHEDLDGEVELVCTPQRCWIERTS